MGKSSSYKSSSKPQPQRVAHGKKGKIIGAPHRTSPPQVAPDQIPVDPTRATVPIPGLPAGKRKT